MTFADLLPHRGSKPLIRPTFVGGIRVAGADQLAWATSIGADHETEPVIAHAADLTDDDQRPRVWTICREPLAGLSIFRVDELHGRDARWCDCCWTGPRCDCGTPLPTCGVCVACLRVGLDEDKAIARADL